MFCVGVRVSQSREARKESGSPKYAKMDNNSSSDKVGTLVQAAEGDDAVLMGSPVKQGQTPRGLLRSSHAASFSSVVLAMQGEGMEDAPTSSPGAAARHALSQRIIGEAFDDNRHALKNKVKQLMAELHVYKNGSEYNSLKTSNVELQARVGEYEALNEKLKHELAKSEETNAQLEAKVKELSVKAAESKSNEQETRQRLQKQAHTLERKLADVEDKSSARLRSMQLQYKTLNTSYNSLQQFVAGWCSQTRKLLDTLLSEQGVRTIVPVPPTGDCSSPTANPKRSGRRLGGEALSTLGTGSRTGTPRSKSLATDSELSTAIVCSSLQPAQDPESESMAVQSPGQEQNRPEPIKVPTGAEIVMSYMPMPPTNFEDELNPEEGYPVLEQAGGLSIPQPTESPTVACGAEVSLPEHRPEPSNDIANEPLSAGVAAAVCPGTTSPKISTVASPHVAVPSDAGHVEPELHRLYNAIEASIRVLQNHYAALLQTQEASLRALTAPPHPPPTEPPPAHPTSSLVEADLMAIPVAARPPAYEPHGLRVAPKPPNVTNKRKPSKVHKSLWPSDPSIITRAILNERPMGTGSKPARRHGQASRTPEVLPPIASGAGSSRMPIAIPVPVDSQPLTDSPCS
mmetsp:Transcript_34882/g.62335  ORF Transcript_34882/g.62335 Transcript_34882/m.62335 type:complete len:629 (-) Transcript_34882:872-2758(-)